MFHYAKQEIVHPLTTGSLKGFQVAFFTDIKNADLHHTPSCRNLSLPSLNDIRTHTFRQLERL